MADTVPAFDFRRWGVGGIATVAALLILGLVAFLDGLFRGSIPLQVLGAICLGGGITIFVIKIGEEIHPVTAKWGIVGEVGEVVSEVSKLRAGTVQVRSELWSAKSELPIGLGTKVRVVRTEGLVAWVTEMEEPVLDRREPEK